MDKTIGDIVSRELAQAPITPSDMLGIGMRMAENDALFDRSIGRAIIYAPTISHRQRLINAFPELVARYLAAARAA
jgi:hypothetical protein